MVSLELGEARSRSHAHELTHRARVSITIFHHHATDTCTGYYRVGWAANGTNMSFARCSIKENCLGGKGSSESCLVGTTGPFCESCMPDFARSGSGKCTKCLPPGQQNAAFAAGIIVGTAAIAFLVRGTLKAQGSPSDVSMGVIKIGMRHFQLAALAASFPLEWPSEIGEMFAFMHTASSAGDQAVALDCQLGSSIVPGSGSLFFGSMFAAKALIGFIIPPLLIAGFAVFWVVYTRLYEGRAFGDKTLKSSRDQEGSGGESNGPNAYQSSFTTRLVVSTLVLAMMFHPTITKTTFGFFKCSAEVEGRSLLEADMNVVCGSAYHSRLLSWVAGPAMIIYVIGIPLAAFAILYSNKAKDKLSKPGCRRKLGFLYSNYEEEYYYWEFVVVARLVSFAAVSVMFADKADLQAGLGLFILFVSILAHNKTSPYLEDTLDRVEEMGLYSSWLTL